MAITFVDDTADAGQTEFLFNFPYLEDEHVAVFIDGVRQTIGSGEDYTVQTSPSKRIVLNVAATGGEIVRVRRISDPANDLVDFQNGSVLTESELDRSYLHNRYLAEESAEQNDISLRVQAGADDQFDALNKKIINVSDPTADQDAATKNYVDDTVASVVGGAIPDGSITTSKLSNAAVTTAKIDDDAVTTAKIEDAAVTSDKTDFDQLTIEADTVSEGQEGIAALEIVGVSGSLIDLRQDPEGDFDVRLINQTQSTRLDSKDPFLIRAGTPLNTALNVHTDGKVQVGSPATPSYALDVAGDVNVTGNFKVNGTNLTTGVPTGTVSAFAGSAAPTGYVLCDGSAVNRTTEAALFAVIGTTYGIGDGSTTFNLPDLRGRVVAGTGGSLLSGTDALSDTGGAKTHTLTEDEMPAHTHGIGGTANQMETGNSSFRLSPAANSIGDTKSTGGGQAHNNVQPTIILNYIIKT